MNTDEANQIAKAGGFALEAGTPPIETIVQYVGWLASEGDRLRAEVERLSTTGLSRANVHLQRRDQELSNEVKHLRMVLGSIAHHSKSDTPLTHGEALHTLDMIHRAAQSAIAREALDGAEG